MPNRIEIDKYIEFIREKHRQNIINPKDVLLSLVQSYSDGVNNRKRTYSTAEEDKDCDVEHSDYIASLKSTLDGIAIQDILQNFNIYLKQFDGSLQDNFFSLWAAFLYCYESLIDINVFPQGEPIRKIAIVAKQYREAWVNVDIDNTTNPDPSIRQKAYDRLSFSKIPTDLEKKLVETLLSNTRLDPPKNIMPLKVLVRLSSSLSDVSVCKIINYFLSFYAIKERNEDIRQMCFLQRQCRIPLEMTDQLIDSYIDIVARGLEGSEEVVIPLLEKIILSEDQKIKLIDALIDIINTEYYVFPRQAALHSLNKIAPLPDVRVVSVLETFLKNYEISYPEEISNAAKRGIEEFIFNSKVIPDVEACVLRFIHKKIVLTKESRENDECVDDIYLRNLKIATKIFVSIKASNAAWDDLFKCVHLLSNKLKKNKKDPWKYRHLIENIYRNNIFPHRIIVSELDFLLGEHKKNPVFIEVPNQHNNPVMMVIISPLAQQLLMDAELLDHYHDLLTGNDIKDACYAITVFSKVRIADPSQIMRIIQAIMGVFSKILSGNEQISLDNLYEYYEYEEALGNLSRQANIDDENLLTQLKTWVLDSNRDTCSDACFIYGNIRLSEESIPHIIQILEEAANDANKEWAVEHAPILALSNLCARKKTDIERIAQVLYSYVFTQKKYESDISLLSVSSVFDKINEGLKEEELQNIVNILTEKLSNAITSASPQRWAYVGALEKIKIPKQGQGCKLEEILLGLVESEKLFRESYRHKTSKEIFSILDRIDPSRIKTTSTNYFCKKIDDAQGEFDFQDIVSGVGGWPIESLDVMRVFLSLINLPEKFKNNQMHFDYKLFDFFESHASKLTTPERIAFKTLIMDHFSVCSTENKNDSSEKIDEKKYHLIKHLDILNVGSTCIYMLFKRKALDERSLDVTSKRILTNVTNRCPIEYLY